MQLFRRKFLVFGLLALALNSANLLAQSCDPDFVVIDPNVLRINVLPTGSDDTENIQCALRAAADEGIPIVKLDQAAYFLSSISVEGFNGSFEGTTRSNSVIRILGGSISCNSIAGGGQIPAALKFIEGRPTVQFLRFEFQSTVQPCVSGDPLTSIIHFTGTRTGTSECSNDVIFGQVDRVDFIGRAPGVGSQRAVTAVPEGSLLGGCKDTLLGTIKVNRSTFSDFAFAVSTELRGLAQVDINFNSFSHAASGTVADITLLDTGQSTSIIGNEFSGSSDPGEGYVAVFLATTDANSPSTTRLAIENNMFQIEDFGSAATAIAVGLDSAPQALNTLVAISNNTFNLISFDDTEATGIFVSGGISGNTVTNNRFIGGGIGIFMVSDSAIISDWFIGSNSGFVSLTSSLADVVFFTNTFNNIMGPNQSASVIDQGNNFIFTGNSGSSSSGTLDSVKTADGGSRRSIADLAIFSSQVTMQEQMRLAFQGK